MKHLFTALLALAVLLPAQNALAGWQFAKVFPDTAFKAPTGAHGIAVDPDGKVWIQAYNNSDSIFDATSGTFRPCRQIFVFNPDGTPAPFNGFKTVTIGATTDTLYNSNRGMRADADGNIIFASFDTYYKIDYKTGAGIAKVNPFGFTLTAPAITAANELLTGVVIPGQGKIDIYDSGFNLLGTAVDAPAGFSRTLEVSPDGNDIYWCGYTTQKIQIYHSDNGTLGPYVLADSFAIGCQVESIGWNPKDGYLYASSGNVDTVDYTPPIPAPWEPEIWYAFDPSDLTVKDTIRWNRDAYPYPYSPVTFAPRPRGIAFSPDGDTAYVACYNYAGAPVQMFTRTATSVEPVDNTVPTRYQLAQNYPNPFNPSTVIEFSLPKAGMTVLKVYNLLGQEVATLVNEELGAGTYKTSFNATHLSSGTYIYTLTSADQVISKKMLLVK